MSYGTIALVAFAIFLLTPLSRITLAALFGRAIGKAALARQPDTIHLKPTELSRFRHASRVTTLASQYHSRGFEDAGVFAIPEMPGINVQLLANRTESMYGVIYDHPVVGVFYDVVSYTTDGSAWTHTTARQTGLKQRPTSHMTNLPGAEPAALIDTARRERPASGLRPSTTSAAVSDFENAYAEYMMWIKQRGISAGEVVEVAKRKVA